MTAETKQELFNYLSGELEVTALSSNLFEIENIIMKGFQEIEKKAKKWDSLDEKIAKCYVDENGEELSEEDSENIDLGTIGEIAAGAFGWL